MDEPSGHAKPRNPPWVDEELILALDLYLRSGHLDNDHPEVIELSRALNDLPLQPNRPNVEKFRNPNGVSLKLANFAAIDPAHPGKGMTRGGKREEAYIEHLEEADQAVLCVALADKRHNARCIVNDATELGPEFWNRFNAGPDEQIWYYTTVAEVITRRRPGPAADELRRQADHFIELQDLAPKIARTHAAHETEDPAAA